MRIYLVFAQLWHCAHKVDHNNGVQELDALLTSRVSRVHIINVSLRM